MVGQRQARRQQEDPYYNRGGAHGAPQRARRRAASRRGRVEARWRHASVEWAAGKRAKDEEMIPARVWLPVLEGALANVERDSRAKV